MVTYQFPLVASRMDDVGCDDVSSVVCRLHFFIFELYCKRRGRNPDIDPFGVDLNSKIGFKMRTSDAEHQGMVAILTRVLPLRTFRLRWPLQLVLGGSVT
jgi:hypothetical protein